MSKEFDVVEYVGELPPAIRRNVLFSLVGSLNASLITKSSTCSLARTGSRARRTRAM